MCLRRGHPRGSLPVRNPWPYNVICARQRVPQGFKTHPDTRDWADRTQEVEVFPTSCCISAALNKNMNITFYFLQHAWSKTKTDLGTNLSNICQVFSQEENWNRLVWLYFSIFPSSLFGGALCYISSTGLTTWEWWYLETSPTPSALPPSAWM